MKAGTKKAEDTRARGNGKGHKEGTIMLFLRSSAEKISKKPAPESERRVAEEGLKRKHGEIEVKESKKAKRAVEEKISEAEEVISKNAVV
ncbi:hypothetical protein TIFTF001_032732 [Ficus carica]|uniref:Uncharacterized protein n=1 Tax=Ficus carica TaxID=3494 RepID=A0AA88DXQ7_FICCA|nr:hypothetical protein TIFTF001_032732 [Ficus carica]